MDNDYVLQVQHQECQMRIAEENARQNARIKALEESMQQIHSISVSVERLATSIDHMSSQLKENTEKVKALESVPHGHWNTFVKGLIGAAAGIIGAGMIYAIIGGIK